MKNTLIFFCLFPFAVFAHSLKSGDLLLQPLRCYSCSLIESETNSEYSHIGMYIKFDSVEYVLEAFGGSVKKTPLLKFLERTQKGLFVKAIRHNELSKFIYIPWRYKEFRIKLFHLFEDYFEGKPYDKEFLWFNTDKKGEEKLYCSEFVQKLLAEVIDDVPQPSVMDFSKNYKAWKKHFKGSIPYNEIGLSPADFDRSELFSTIEFL